MHALFMEFLHAFEETMEQKMYLLPHGWKNAGVSDVALTYGEVLVLPLKPLNLY